jgi:hypothetical protein
MSNSQGGSEVPGQFDPAIIGTPKMVAERGCIEDSYGPTGITSCDADYDFF